MSDRHKIDPVARARGILERLGISAEPIPVEKIAKALGAEVRLSALDDEISGMIYIQDDVPIIGINSLHHPNRQRFTLAHEIGHLELHRHVLTNTVHVDKKLAILMRSQASSTGKELMEIQANRFAAELLMPIKRFERALLDTPVDIDDEAPVEALAKKFKVSKQAIEFRIRNLALVR